MKPAPSLQDLHKRRHGLVCALFLLGACPMLALGDPSQPATRAAAGIALHANQLQGDEITAAQELAVSRGLAWLTAHQAPDGGFKVADNESSAVTALAAISMMEAGNLPNRGQYGVNVSRALSYVLSCCQESGLIISEHAQTPPMYGHGFATLFLAEVYGMTRDDSITEKLQKAVSLIEQSQSAQPGNEGGWRYQPIAGDADISVTICQVMALRAARDAGIFVDPSVIDRAIKYVQSCQNRDGGFSYMSRMSEPGASGFARSAAAISALYYAGRFQGSDIDRGLAYLTHFLPTARGANAPGSDAFYFYGNYYGVQAMFLAGGDYWINWYPAIRQQLISRQGAAGNWSGEVSDDYCTSMALIILQMPNRYLPVFNGKGPGD
jgi:prenyltransferase beta subunit